MQEKFDLLKVDVAFLGPYQFDLSPCESLFAQIKCRDLNPEGLPIVSK